jgi:hypothetical protein
MKSNMRSSSILLALALAACGLLALPAARAATRTKQDNTDALNLASSWDTLPGPADIAQWTNIVTVDNTTASLGADLSWAGIKIVDPGGLVTLNSGNTLTIGASGIDLSTATQDLTLNCGLTLRGGRQLWKAAAGRTLNVAGTFTRTGNVVDFNSFNATATLGGLANAGTTGILGPWATTGSLTTLNYVKSTAGAISTYTGQTDGTAGSLANVTDPNVNYKFGAAATLTGPITANTLLFNGAASILDNAGNTIALNGLLCPGAGALQITGTGNLMIGATKELVVFWTKGQGRIGCPVVDNSGGDSTVTLNIASGANHYIDGVDQVAGEWGSADSGAANQSVLFTGTGKLNVGTLGDTLTYGISGKVTLGGAGLAGVTVSDGTRSATTASDSTYMILEDRR